MPCRDSISGFRAVDSHTGTRTGVGIGAREHIDALYDSDIQVWVYGCPRVRRPG